jgi:hypothetical protein
MKNYENKFSEFEKNLYSLTLGENTNLKEYASHLHDMKTEHKGLIDLSRNLDQFKTENLVKLEQKTHQLKNEKLNLKEPGCGERRVL